ncbi:DUF6600 domain-containing protein [Paraburkholderia flava]|uniref:DUF6600 domain-containing protein n=1 Tax=Paraburkholderia flava TaxID=2547393 RepID=UPI00105C8B76|nr:DUF6600 domain-containing protein [Paraburkholderia flava]
MPNHTPDRTHAPLSNFRRVIRPTLFAIAVLALAGQSIVQPVLAQEAPPPDAAPAGAQQNVDPPGRVARLNYTSGAVTTEPAGATDWSYAQINRPLTTGDQLWNDRGARSELHIGSTAVRVGESTSLDVLNLDDSSAQLKVTQGTLSTHVRELPPGSSYEIDTPNVALGINGAGDYRVDVAPDGSSTTVTVRAGNATVYGDGGQVPIAAGQQIRFAGTNLQQLADNRVPAPDAFDQWAGSRDVAEDRSVSARYVSRDIPGYEDLDANGAWRSSPQYGEVWVPNAVPTGWAPYHDGHWVWQAPWGWTWVDDAPWGFAPYHYGRWAYVDDSWAWVPGPVVVSAPPVYAPALVAFVGGDSHFNWGVSLAIGGIAAAGVAWFPLGPGEAWHPRWGGWSPHYYDRVNRTVVVNNINRSVNVTNITNIHNTYINYRAPGALTAVPATAFVHGQPVGRFAQKVNPNQWHNAQINPGGPGIAPVRGSFGSGLRNANYRPPAAVAQRAVVATRNPGVPPAYHDQLAQRFAQGNGGRVPGAGQPVVRTSVPAHFVGSTAQQQHGIAGVPTQNVRIVQSHMPGRMPGAAPGAAVPGGPQVAGQRPGVNETRPGAVPGHAPAVAEVQARGERPQPQSQPNNGVPRPPQFAGHGPEGNAGEHPAAQGQLRQPEASREPAWTQQHAPMAQQAQAQQQQHAPQPGNPVHAEQPPAPNRNLPAEQQHMPPREQPQQQAARAPEMRPAEPQPRPQPQPMQQPRQEPRPQPVQQQPRPEFHPQPAQQPRPEFHPQPQPQPRQEFHPPQQVQQPRPEPRPQPRPSQPAQHQEQHSGGGHEEQHKG